MRPGRRVHRVTFQRPVENQDESGDVRPESWETFAIVPASVEPLKGREVFEQERVVAEVDTRIQCRWYPQLDEVVPKWRIRFADVIYDIASVAHLQLRHREIEFMCKSGSNEG